MSWCRTCGRDAEQVLSPITIDAQVIEIAQLIVEIESGEATSDPHPRVAAGQTGAGHRMVTTRLPA